jgi:hypothetical protein
MPAIYERDELTFQYPDNWKIDEEPSAGIPRTVSVTAGSGAYWSAMIYDLSSSSEQDLQREYVETFQQEYEDLEFEPVEIAIGEEKLNALDLQFYCLDFLVHSRCMIRQIGNYRVLIAWQAEDRDFDSLEPVFAAITFSAIDSGI